MSNSQPTKIPGQYNGWDDGTEHSIQQFKQGRMNVEIMPEGYILLAKELATGMHGTLEARLKAIPPDEWDEKIATISQHCGVVLDGIYSIQELSNLCAILAGRLQVLREVCSNMKPQIIL